MAKIPSFKKTVSAFLTREDGRISKKKLITLGLVAASFAAASSVAHGHTSSYNPNCGGFAPENSAAHANSLGLTQSAQSLTGTHNHCIETHSSHSSHSNHSSHGSHNSSW
jgi:hypothetical protein